MSGAATRMGFTEAYVIAEHFADYVRHCCERLVIAGSLRRRSDDVGDIEIVAVPKVRTMQVFDLFDELMDTEHVDELSVELDNLVESGRIQKRVTNGHGAWGPKYKRLSFEGAPFDVFSCDAERFGLILAIRTGPAWYSHQMVTPKDRKIQAGQRQGLLPPHLRVADGWLTSRVSGQRIPTPEEIDFYRELGLPFVAPEDRR